MSIKQINTPTLADDKDAVGEFYQQFEDIFLKNEAKLSPIQLGTLQLRNFDCQMHKLSKRSNGNWLLILAYWMKETFGWTLFLSWAFLLNLRSKLNVLDIHADVQDFLAKIQAILKDEHAASEDHSESEYNCWVLELQKKDIW